jgi:hypothetical protein
MNELAQATVAQPAQQMPGQELAPPPIPSPLDAVASGQAPAVALPPVEPNGQLLPAQEFVIENYAQLPQIGLAVFEAQDLSTVVYNPAMVDEASLMQADQEGTLAQLLSAATPMSPEQAAAPAVAAPPPPPVEPAPAPKVPAGTQDMLARARVRNVGAGPKQPGLAPNPVSGAVASRPV